MAKRKTVEFKQKKQMKEKIYIKIGAKEYKLKNDVYTANLVIRLVNEIEDADENEVLDKIFQILEIIYGKSNVEEIATNNEDMDWVEFINFSVQQMTGAVGNELSDDDESKNA